MSEEHFRRLYGEAIDVIGELLSELRRKDEEIHELEKELEALKTPKSPTRSRRKGDGKNSRTNAPNHLWPGVPLKPYYI